MPFIAWGFACFILVYWGLLVLTALGLSPEKRRRLLRLYEERRPFSKEEIESVLEETLPVEQQQLVEDLVDAVQQEATEDIHKMSGASALNAPYLTVNFWTMLNKRAGWLSALFLGEMLTATAMSHFEKEIARAVVLALFIPLIISTGGNSGSQSAAFVIRAMALGELTLKDWHRVLLKELPSGVILGAFLGMVGFCRILLWQMLHLTDYGPHYVLIALTVWLSLIGVVLFGTVAGSMLPLLLRWAGFDPATGAEPFVATLVDVSGTIIYFTVAMLILRGTLL
jgi:magnesium transporter